MNIANKLTFLRVLLIPIFLLVLYVVEGSIGNYIATLIFVVASLTDWLDGYLARKLNLVSDFGKFIDPLADKLLVAAALIYFVEINRLSAVIVIVIISREFIISGFRLVAALKNRVIAASMWGKVKTSTTMVMIIVLLLEIDNPLVKWLEVLLIFAATLFTVISAIDYIMKNSSVLKE
jgi:CDP-diacylglycerol--glycerol-3-phosphate 3-phosphatidyltransferase